jgi:type 1 glutamine amidotransferase
MFALAFAAALLAGPAFAQELKPDVIEKIGKALPAEAPAKPSKERKVLVYTRASGFVHGSIPIGAKAFEMMGATTGAFKVTKVTDDPAVFDDLSGFDAIVLLSTTGDFMKINLKKEATDEQKKAAEEAKIKEPVRKANLLNFVAQGGGLVGIHAASDAYYGWPEYGQMIGGYFQNHPYSKIQIKNEEPNSPINAQFEGKDFEYTDEIYVFRPNSFSRDRLRVLLSIDVAKSNLKEKARPDEDYAVAWIRGHGQGRVFYTLLGHRNETWFDPLALKYFLAGTQYALGDLKADATPKTASPK